ncbi:MAG: nucleotidyl transferase AbiEii/AbiGii toxin family protein [Actinomycetota bacterium]
MEPGDQLSAIVDTARALQSAAIPFALIGGIAVGIRSGVPRATDDVDIAVATTASRALVTEVLENGGLALRREFEHSLNFRHSNSEPVQIAFDPDFDAMIERSKPIYVQGLEVPVVLIEDLIEMKQRAAQAPGRRRSKALRDRADVELLKGDAPDPDEGW